MTELEASGHDAVPRPTPKRSKKIGRTISRWLKRALLVALAVGGIAAIAKSLMPKPVPVDVATVANGPLTVTVDEDGKARVKDRYVVSAPLSGRLARIELDPGDEVKQGAILARIAPLAPPLLDARTKSTAEARVAASTAAKRQTAAQTDRATAALEFAKTESVRTRKLVETGAMTGQQLDQAMLAERTATADAESARFAQRVADYELQMAVATLGHLDKRKDDGEQLDVPSPVDGRILNVLNRSEGAVQPGTALVEVGDPRALEIVIDVLTSDAVKIKPGALVTIDRWGGEPIEGRVRLVEPSAFTRLSALGVEEQRVNAVIDLAAPVEQWGTLGDGYRVEAHIRVWHDDAALKVPASAVFRHQDGWALYRVDGKIARLQPVTIGERTARDVQILQGMDAGMQVVLHPSDRVRDGVEIVAR
ncbi:MAG: efflux RND transporter periplasmic adaptor subunit [Polyangiaceae bacterium]|nr:efflux RND transporter periplasmic adaptor subunit [Polyangiaceae bacterium]